MDEKAGYSMNAIIEKLSKDGEKSKAVLYINALTLMRNVEGNYSACIEVLQALVATLDPSVGKNKILVYLPDYKKILKPEHLVTAKSKLDDCEKWYKSGADFMSKYLKSGNPIDGVSFLKEMPSGSYIKQYEGSSYGDVSNIFITGYYPDLLCAHDLAKSYTFMLKSFTGEKFSSGRFGNLCVKTDEPVSLTVPVLLAFGDGKIVQPVLTSKYRKFLKENLKAWVHLRVEKQAAYFAENSKANINDFKWKGNKLHA